jgi:alcohol dehydrogenase
MKNTTRIALFEGKHGQVVLRDLPLPVPTAGETLVRVLGCTLCGSDLHSFEGRRQVPVPTILGHEIVGEIIDQGPGGPREDPLGQSLNLGDRVTWAIVADCGECFYCRRGLPQKCQRGVKYGHEPFRDARSLNGGLASHCLLAPGSTILRLPSEMPLGMVTPASCSTATIAAACEAAGDLHGADVGIFGAGLLGLTACAMAHDRGASRVFCVEPAPQRRSRAVEFGAVACESAGQMQSLLQATAAPPGLDVVLELSGSTPALEQALPLLRIGGTAVLVGAVFPGPPAGIVPEQIVRRQLTLRGVHNYAPRHLEQAVRFLTGAVGRWPLADLVTDWIPLDQIGRAFELARDPARIRVGVVP